MALGFPLAKHAILPNRHFHPRPLRSRYLHLESEWSMSHDQPVPGDTWYAKPRQSRRKPGFGYLASGLQPMAAPRGRRPSTINPLPPVVPEETPLERRHQKGRPMSRTRTEKIATKAIWPTSKWPVVQLSVGQLTFPQVTTHAGQEEAGSTERYPRTTKPATMAKRWERIVVESIIWSWANPHKWAALLLSILWITFK